MFTPSCHDDAADDIVAAISGSAAIVVCGGEALLVVDRPSAVGDGRFDRNNSFSVGFMLINLLHSSVDQPWLLTDTVFARTALG